LPLQANGRLTASPAVAKHDHGKRRFSMLLRIAASVPWMQNYSTVSEKFFIGVTMTLLGLSIVFLVLVLISFMVSALGRLAGGRRKQETPPVTEPAASVHQPAAVTAASSEEPETDATLIAVLAAAIAAFTTESAPRSSAGFTIRRVRRV